MSMVWLLALAWAAVIAFPVARAAHRVTVRERASSLVAARSARVSALTVWVTGRLIPDALMRLARTVVSVVSVPGARRRERRARAELERELPVVVDLLGVAVAAGCTPYLAIGVTERWGPPRFAAVSRAVTRACELGSAFDAALDDMARASPPLRPITDTLLSSERLGAPVRLRLARLADDARAAQRRRAEAHARRVPVRLLFPLVFLVLPAFVLLTVVPGLASGLQRI